MIFPPKEKNTPGAFPEMLWRHGRALQGPRLPHRPGAREWLPLFGPGLCTWRIQFVPLAGCPVSDGLLGLGEIWVAKVR